MVRCKFQLSKVTFYPSGSRKFVFTPQYDSSIPEDQRFAKATPSGKFEIYVDNQSVDWQVGQFYYFDASPVPAPC